MFGNLVIRNFRHIKNIDIEINKINIVVGKNSLGKSILSKLLFSFLIPLSSEGKYVTNIHIKEYFSNFINSWSKYFSMNSKEYKELNQIIENWEDKNENIEYFIKQYENLKNTSVKLELLDKSKCMEDLNCIWNIIELNKDIESRFENISKYVLNSEFGLSKCNKYPKNSEVSFKVNKNNYSDSFLFESVHYIDSPSILDLNNTINLPYHLKLNFRNLKSEDVNEDYVRFEDCLSSLIGGEFKYDTILDRFYFSSNSNEFELWNTASSSKQLGVFQLLFSKNKIKNSFIIFDEPEMKLHPELQVRFCEILVRLVKDLNLSLYINSHSPYIVEAIEVFAIKYGLINDVNFYLADLYENNKFTFTKISREDLDEIYTNLGFPYEELNSLRFHYDLKDKYGFRN